MDEVSYHKAMESFAKAYPHAFKMLEKIRRDTPATIQPYKKSYVKSLGNDRIKERRDRSVLRQCLKLDDRLPLHVPVNSARTIYYHE
jgi:hypothetical protein